MKYYADDAASLYKLLQTFGRFCSILCYRYVHVRIYRFWRVTRWRWLWTRSSTTASATRASRSSTWRTQRGRRSCSPRPLYATSSAPRRSARYSLTASPSAPWCRYRPQHSLTVNSYWCVQCFLCVGDRDCDGVSVAAERCTMLPLLLLRLARDW